MPTISIIVPVYKVEPYIHRCVDSILNQTFTDFELILVDDGSPDNCPTICDNYAAQDSRVHVIHQKNSGVSAARNVGLDTAIGQYILFCDSDDYVSPTWFDDLVKFITTTKDNYIFGNYIMLSENSLLPFCQSFSQKEYLTKEFVDLQLNDRVGYIWNVLFYSDVINSNHLRFIPSSINEDLAFCLSYLQHMKSITFCGTCGYFYMQQGLDSLSHKYTPDIFSKWQSKYQLLSNFIKNNIPKADYPAYFSKLSNNYLFLFLNSLNNTFDKRNTWSFYRKLCYNRGVVNSEEFQHCLSCADTSNESQTYLNFLRKRNYLAAYLYSYAAKLKSRLLK